MEYLSKKLLINTFKNVALCNTFTFIHVAMKKCFKKVYVYYKSAMSFLLDDTS